MAWSTCRNKFSGKLSPGLGLWGLNHLLYWETVRAQNGVSRLSGGIVPGFQSPEATSNPDLTVGLGGCLAASPFSAHPGRDC